MSASATLLRCETCGHSADAHAGGGCDRRDCACPAHRQEVIDANIATELTPRP